MEIMLYGWHGRGESLRKTSDSLQSGCHGLFHRDPPEQIAMKNKRFDNKNKKVRSATVEIAMKNKRFDWKCFPNK